MRFEDTVALALAAGFFAFVAVSLLLRWTGQVESQPIAERLSGPRFLLIALAFLPMALFEEFIFRWLLIGQLARLITLAPAFVTSVVLFIVAHRPNARLHYLTVMNLAAVSVIFGLVYLRWGLWTVTAAHAGWNMAEWGLGYAVSGPKTRTLLPSPAHREVKGEPFGPEGHWAATVVLLVVLAIFSVTGGKV